MKDQELVLGVLVSIYIHTKIFLIPNDEQVHAARSFYKLVHLSSLRWALIQPFK